MGLRYESRVDEIRQKWEWLSKVLGEREKRLWVGAEARALGHGGVKAVSVATGMSRVTVRRGVLEVEGAADSKAIKPGGARRSGGGRPRIETQQKGIREALLKLVAPATRGEPESALRWTSKSIRTLADELKEQGFKLSYDTVARMLREENFSLQAPRKTHEGRSNPDRDAQFHNINRKIWDFHERGQPVISVDTKKKELIGEFHNKGREWQPAGTPEQVNTYDFPSLADGKAVPYGVYDILNNEGWVSVGISADTSTLR